MIEYNIVRNFNHSVEISLDDENYKLFKKLQADNKDLTECVDKIAPNECNLSLREVRSSLTTDSELIEMAFRYNELAGETQRKIKERNKSV